MSETHRPGKDARAVQPSAAGDGGQGAATARLQADGELELTVRPHDTLRNLARSLYRQYGHHEADAQELKAFELDAGKRNNLSKGERDNLHPGQVLRVTLPGVTLIPEKAVAVGKPAAAAPAEVRNIMRGADSCHGEWSNMVANWVTHNEVSKQKFLAFNPDDGGHGISVGLLQWNQKRGRLPELLQDWHKQDPAKFDRFFGAQAANLLKGDWVRKADFVGTPALYNGMRAALADSEFQQVQLGLRNRHIVKSCEVAQDNGFKSLRGRAVVADLFNQIGETGTVQALRRVPAAKSESLRIEELKRVTGGRVNGHDRVSLIEENVKDIWRKLGSS